MRNNLPKSPPFRDQRLSRKDVLCGGGFAEQPDNLMARHRDSLVFVSPADDGQFNSAEEYNDEEDEGIRKDASMQDADEDADDDYDPQSEMIGKRHAHSAETATVLSANDQSQTVTHAEGTSTVVTPPDDDEHGPTDSATVASHSSKSTLSSKSSSSSTGRGRGVQGETFWMEKIPETKSETKSVKPSSLPTEVGQSVPQSAQTGAYSLASVVSDFSGHSEFHTKHDTTKSPKSAEADAPDLSSQHGRLPGHKLPGDPKSEPYALYGKDPYRKVIGPADYITWNDDGPPHNLSSSSTGPGRGVQGETFWMEKTPEATPVKPPSLPTEVGQSVPQSAQTGNYSLASEVSDFSGHAAFHTKYETTKNPKSAEADAPDLSSQHGRLPGHKLPVDPKSEPYALYGKDPYRKAFGPADYITWNDDGPPHNLSSSSTGPGRGVQCETFWMEKTPEATPVKPPSLPTEVGQSVPQSAQTGTYSFASTGHAAFHTKHETTKNPKSTAADEPNLSSEPRRLPGHKLPGAPKSNLYALYGKDPYRKVIGQADYITWNDDGPPHNLRFTSFFVCPVSGEIFPSGRHGPEDKPMYVEKDGFYWYKSRKLAEHGAAARAYDCLSFRSTPSDRAYYHIGSDDPYPKQRRYILNDSASIPPRAWKLTVDAQARAPGFDAEDDELERDLFK